MTFTLLTTDDPELEGRIRAAIGAVNGDLRRLGSEFFELEPGRAVTSLTADSRFLPAVLAIGPDVDEDRALALALAVEAASPATAVVLLAPPLKALLERAMRAGVREVIAPEAPPEQLRQAFERARESANRRREHLVTDGGGSQSRVITVISPKGGSGKTMLSVNLAVALASLQPDDVVLADYDLQFGDVASALRLVPDHSTTNAAGVSDPLAVKAALTPHPSGLFALCAPDSPVDSEHISGSAAGQVISLLSSQFATVVVDTSAGLNEHTLAALEVSTDILFVCTMDVPSVRSLRKVIVTLDQVEMTSQARHFVLNRAHSRVGLDAEDIARTVGMAVDFALPSSRSVPLSMNQGVPVIEADPKSQAARQIRQLATRFAPEQANTRGSKPRGWRK